MEINKHQRHLLAAFGFLVAVTILFPPFHFSGANGASRSLGFSFIFTPPFEGATVNIGLLLTIWLGSTIVACIMYLLLRGHTDSHPENQKLSLREAPDVSVSQLIGRKVGAFQAVNNSLSPSKRVLRVALYCFAAIFYLVAIVSIFKNPEFTFAGLAYTLSNGPLLVSLIIGGLGVLAPAFVFHFLASRIK